MSELSRSNIQSAYDEGMRDFSGADLRGANLRGANLRGAKLPDKFDTVQFNHVGSEGGCLVATIYPDGTHTVQRGCFLGTLDEFVAAVAKKPEGDKHRLEYEEIWIPALRAWFARHEESTR